MEETVIKDDDINKDESSVQEETGGEKDSTAELNAFKELFTEMKSEVDALKKENAALKVANAKLAITQTVEKVESPEEIINKLFK